MANVEVLIEFVVIDTTGANVGLGTAEAVGDGAGDLASVVGGEDVA